jgi:116 kDa U5 small nuclear ribonucleoprotein component
MSGFYRYHLDLLNVKERCRNVSVVGQLHHGKTSLIDLLVEHCLLKEPVKPRSSIKSSYSREKLPRYLDSLKLEQERGISLRAKPICLLLEDSKTSASYAVNLIDCPGHADFREEVGVSLSILSESVLLVVDSVEGVQSETEAILKAALNLGKTVILVLSKIERLWLELKLPPTDSYYKLKHTVDRLNTIAGKCLFAPESGNVLFASALAGFCFSLQSFVKLKYPNISESEAFARRLWGDCFYSQTSKKFTAQPNESAPKRTFITFVLEPLYKIYTQSISASNPESLQKFLLEHVDDKLNAKELFKSNPRPMLKQVFKKFFCNEPILGLIDVLINGCCADNTSLNNMPNGGLLMSICKVFPPASIKSHPHTELASIDQPRVLCRLWEGRIRSGQDVFIHGTETEEVLKVQIGKVFIPCTRYELVVEGETAAPWVLLTGIPLDRIIKYGIVSDDERQLPCPPLSFIPNSASFFRVSIEPLVPSELPKMLQTLRLLNLVYPSMRTHVEESGEHVLKGPGELYLDCILHDLRTMGQVQIRLSDPSASLAETVSEMSTLKCFADTANGKLRITMLAEPMEKGLPELIESKLGNLPEEAILIDKFGWDRLSCRSIMSTTSTGNVLIDDTFGESTPGLLETCRGSLIQGFQWAVREGPLCEEAIRGVKFRLLGISLIKEEASDNVISLNSLSPAQIVPATRRCCYAAFLTAAPRLLEPIQSVSILSPGECVEVIYNLLARRRGHILSDTPLAGTPLYNLQALLPLLDSPGFEVDLRSMTAGSAMPHSTFSHWQAIPGDPLDQSIKAALLEPAAAPALARDCLLKMRRRRGIGEDVKLEKYFDPEVLEILRRE